MNTFEVDSFKLVQESANFSHNQRLAELAQISYEVVQSRQPPLTETINGNLSIDESIDLYLHLKNFKNLTFEDLATRFVFLIEGWDKNYYLLQLQPSTSVGGFEILIGSVSVSLFTDPNDPKGFSLHYTPTAGFAEQLTVTDQSTEQAYLTGLGRIAALARRDSRPVTRFRSDQQTVLGRLTLKDWTSVDDKSKGFDRSKSGLDQPRRLPRSLLPPNLAVFDAGHFCYIAGLIGAAVAMSLVIGPGWLGFVMAFVPASFLAAWAIAPHA